MKQISLFLLMTIAFAHAYAQKLPNKQEASLRAPANVKIALKNLRVNNVEIEDNTASPEAMEFVNMMLKEGWKNTNAISVRDLMTDTMFQASIF